MFTFIMLLFFEGVLAHQRLLSLTMLRAMRKDPFLLYVYRLGKWNSCYSDKLVPGDIISLTAAMPISTSNSNNLQKRSKQGKINFSFF